MLCLYSEKLRYKSDPALAQTIGTKATQEKKPDVRGLAILDKELFVVSDKCSDVEVYDSITLRFIRQGNVKELNRPLDIGSCNRNKCLYINEFKGRRQSSEILRVNSNGKIIRKWPTGDDYGYYVGPYWGGALSVTKESNVVLTLYEKNRLIEFSPDGHLIRETNLSSDSGFSHPLHAIKLVNGQSAVTHGYSTNEQHRVCIVDANGIPKKSFGGKYGSGIGQMSIPIYMAADENGFVIVIDQKNSRVLLLDIDLEFKREILSKENHGLQRPSKILLDEANGQLLVADNEPNKQRILIYNFK